MMEDEHLDLDEVSLDFLDWFLERVHILSVRQSKNHHDFTQMYNTVMRMHHERDVKKLFGHERSFYNVENTVGGTG
jgi:hypothetical protein